MQALQQRSSTTNLQPNTRAAELKFRVFKCREKGTFENVLLLLFVASTLQTVSSFYFFSFFPIRLSAISSRSPMSPVSFVSPAPFVSPVSLSFVTC